MSPSEESHSDFPSHTRDTSLYPDLMRDWRRTEFEGRCQVFENLVVQMDSLRLNTRDDEILYHESYIVRGVTRRVSMGMTELSGLGETHHVIVNDEHQDKPELHVYDFYFPKNTRLISCTHIVTTKDKRQSMWPTEEVHGPILLRQPDSVVKQAHPNYLPNMPKHADPDDYIEVMERRIRAKTLSAILSELGTTTYIKGLRVAG